MVKSGLIVGAGSFVLALAAGAFVSPLCGLCIGLLGGLAAGYAAGVFDRPAESSSASKSGTGAGAIAGLGVLLGLTIAGVVNSFRFSPQEVADLMQVFGLPVSGDPTVYYAGLIAGPFCTGLFNVALMAGVGALGGMLWHQTGGKSNTAQRF